MQSRKQTAVWIVLAGIFIAALYGQFLHNAIVFDDLYVFMQDNDGHSAVEKFASLSFWDLRALPYATLAWNAQLFGFDLAPFRIENLLLHWAVVIALGLFVLRLYHIVLPEQNATVAVLSVVTLFAVHPVAVYAVGYLVQRSIVMATLFGILSLWAYLKGGKLWLWASVLFYFLATHSKEHLVMLPFAMVALTVLLHRDYSIVLRRNWLVFAAYVGIALLTVAQIKGVIGHPYEIDSAQMLENVPSEHIYADSILTQSWLFFKYGLMWLLPTPLWMSVDMREPLAPGIFSGYAFALIAYLAYGWLAIRLLLKRGAFGLAGFALLFPWLMFFTEFSTVRVQEIFVLYRSYIWAVGGVLLLPLVLMKLDAKLLVLVSVLVGATLFMVSMERLQTFSHPILLWDDAEKLVKDRQSLPGVSRIYYNRGTEWLKVDKYDLALADLQRAVSLNPRMSAAFGNLGATYLKLGQNQLAVDAFSRAILLDQQQKAAPNLKYYQGRAAAYEGAGDAFKAAMDRKVVCLLRGKRCDESSSR